MNLSRILLVVGTHRPGARSLHIAHHYQTLLEARGLAVDLLSLSELPSDFLFSDLYGQRTDAFRAMEARMAAAQLVVFVVPEYNGSFPGELKVFLDAVSRKILVGKHAALIGLGAGKFGNLRGLDHLTAVLNYCQVNVMPFQAHVMHVDQRLDPETGAITHEGTRHELETHAQKVAQYLDQFQPQPVA